MTPGVEEKTSVGWSGAPVQLHYMSDSVLQASITNALAQAGNARSAVLQLEKNETGFNAAVAARLDGHWSIAAAYKRDDWGWAAGSTVKFAW